MQTQQANSSSFQGIGREVAITDLVNVFGSVRAVDGVSIKIAAGEFVAMLGPSGSGKTTTMMSIAGFAGEYTGSIRIGGVEIDHLPPHRRHIGVVFQDLALFPHVTVEDNIAFPLRMRGVSSSDVRLAVRDVLELVRLTGMGGRLPSQLSGGQRQRVALARALVFKPPVLLLDEPFGALDKKLRENLHTEIKALHRQLGVTIVLVTHDQSEAMAMADRVAVMNQGRIEQFAAPIELYNRPANRFVAGFVGESALLVGQLKKDLGSGRWSIQTHGGLTLIASLYQKAAATINAAVEVMIRPEHFSIERVNAVAERGLIGRVTDTTYLGDRIKYDVSLSDTDNITAILPTKDADPDIGIGMDVRVSWDDRRAEIFVN